MTTGAAPVGRSLPAFVYDAATHASLLFGGAGMSDTWTWDGTTRTQLTPSTTPGQLAGSGPDPAVTYDADHQMVLLFGGWGGSGYLNSLWAWDGETWTRLH